MEDSHVVWQDRKRILGMPISFTRYRLDQECLYVTTGILGLRQEEVMLYRIQDLQVEVSPGQWFLGVGTITVLSSDRTAPRLQLQNIRNPKRVREMLHNLSEQAKRERRVRTFELNDMDGSRGDW